MELIDQDKALEIASNLLKVSKAELQSKQLDNGAGYYVAEPIRGGGQVIVANDTSVLFANSGVDYNNLLNSFNQGKRTDPDAFNK